MKKTITLIAVMGLIVVSTVFVLAADTVSVPACSGGNRLSF